MTLLDIIEVYNLRHDESIDNMMPIFNDIELDERLDKETLVGVLLDECGAMQSVYNVTNTFKYFSDLFFKKYKWNITKLVDTLNFQYDPLKNKKLDWTEETDITQNLDTEEDTTEGRSKSNTGTVTDDFDGRETNDFDGTETNTISAMNSNDYEPDNKRVSDTGNVKVTDDVNVKTNNLTERIDAVNNRTKDEDLTWDETDTHTESGTVNITYQELIEKERKVAQFSIYGWIADKYAKELFLLVY